MKTNKLLLATGLSAALLIFTANAQAAFVASSPSIYGFDFRFNTPGARANGMGGAFIGLADDATAAYTNPAGLTILTKPEISLEYKWGEYTTVITEGGMVGGSFSTRETEYNDTVQGPSFVSYVYPRNNSTIAIYRHQLVNIKNNLRYGDPATTLLDMSLELEAQTLGLGLGAKIGGGLSAGLSANFTEMRNWEYTTVKEAGGDSSYETVDGSDQNVHYTASLLWAPIESLSLGLVYRQGPEFSFRKIGYEKQRFSVDSNNDGVIDATDGTIERDIVSFNSQHDVKVPDSYGIGIAYRPIPTFTTSLDVNYVEYSDLAADATDMDGTSINEMYGIDDAYEVHLGLEYVLDLKGTPLALRGGYYYRPGHLFHYIGQDDDPIRQSMLERLIPEGEDDHIFSLGFGTLIGENVQIDLAGSIGDFVKEGTASLVYRFE